MTQKSKLVAGNLVRLCSVSNVYFYDKYGQEKHFFDDNVFLVINGNEGFSVVYNEDGTVYFDRQENGAIIKNYCILLSDNGILYECRNAEYYFCVVE